MVYVSQKFRKLSSRREKGLIRYGRALLAGLLVFWACVCCFEAKQAKAAVSVRMGDAVVLESEDGAAPGPSGQTGLPLRFFYQEDGARILRTPSRAVQKEDNPGGLSGPEGPPVYIFPELQVVPAWKGQQPGQKPGQRPGFPGSGRRPGQGWPAGPGLGQGGDKANSPEKGPGFRPGASPGRAQPGFPASVAGEGGILP